MQNKNDNNNNNRENFLGPPSDLKYYSPGPFFTMKITGQPHWKYVNSISTRKIVVFFFYCSPFLHQPPLKKCLWTVPNDKFEPFQNLMAVVHNFVKYLQTIYCFKAWSSRKRDA